ncbi:PucR family transcriptional regulator [Streptomyces boncukensis]|nr:helix-turn-helix domain-containing protein [Streptomyces boncukensis]
MSELRAELPGTVLWETREGAAAPGGRAAAAPPTADQARRTLFAALTADRGASGAPAPAGTARKRFATLARSARWPLPDAVRAVALPVPCEPPPLSGGLGNALAGPVEGETCLLVPDCGEDARGTLEHQLRGWTAAVGHAVALDDCADSVRWARRLLELETAAHGPGGPEPAGPVFVDDHLTTLLLLQDESLARALTARWLRPLAGLTPRQSERLEVTLLAWLESGGAPEAARTLRVHPQTVRYRLRQIEKVFGSTALRDPRSRFELEAALRGRQLLGRIRRGRARTPGGRKARAVPLGSPPSPAQEARINGL